MDDLYREHILEHARAPRNFGTVEKSDGYLCVRAENVSCGDSLELSLLVDEEGVISDVVWQGHGCAISMASASMLSEQVRGTDMRFWQNLTPQEVLEKLGFGEISAARQKCALLFWRAATSLTTQKGKS